MNSAAHIFLPLSEFPTWAQLNDTMSTSIWADGEAVHFACGLSRRVKILRVQGWSFGSDITALHLSPLLLNTGLHSGWAHIMHACVCPTDDRIVLIRISLFAYLSKESRGHLHDCPEGQAAWFEMLTVNTNLRVMLRSFYLQRCEYSLFSQREVSGWFSLRDQLWMWCH